MLADDQRFLQQVRQDLIHYQNVHQHPINQILHYFAFLSAFLAWIFLFFDWWVTLVLAVLHYLFSWVGHRLFERNHAGFYKRPWLGFYAGFLWFFLRSFELVTGRKVMPK